ncbi:unnamed protein product, partial [Pylaiella littoralis]
MGFPFLKLLLAGIDVAVLVLVVTILASSCKTKQHGARVWATAFHVLVLCWLVLRGMFWMLAITKKEEWQSVSFGLLYWLPNPLQFGSFLLLPMAYSKVLASKEQWEARSRTVGRVYVLLVSGIVVYMVGLAMAQAARESRHFQCVTAARDSTNAPQTCYTMDLSSNAFRVTTGFCFFALAAGVAGYGLKMSKLTTSQNRAQLIYQPRALAALNCFLVAVFLSKGAYQISSVTGLWYLPDLPLKGSEDVCLLNFCVFLFWDYMPTVWLLLVMEGTTGELVGTSVVKAVFPSRILNHGDDMPNLPDYGLFREIKAAAAREAAKAERAAAGSGRRHSYTSTRPNSPKANNSWLREPSYVQHSPGAPVTRGDEYYPTSFQHIGESMSQGGGGFGGGGGVSSSNHGSHGSHDMVGSTSLGGGTASVPHGYHDGRRDRDDRDHHGGA